MVMGANKDKLKADQRVKRERDPYAVLNVPQHATLPEIQRAYKYGSRAFHPDKQPRREKGLLESEQRELEQEAFLIFKDAYDILSNTILRQAYDEHGHFGVEFLRACMISNDHTLYKTLNNLHASGDITTARHVLKDAIQNDHNAKIEKDVPLFTNIELRCSTLHTKFMGEGNETSIVPELEKGTMSFSVGIPQVGGANWHADIGGSSTVKLGEGKVSGQFSAGCEAVPGTEVNVDVGVGEHPKVSIGSSRKMTNGNVASTSITKIFGMESFAWSAAMERVMFQNLIHCKFAFGLGVPDRNFHFAQLAFTSLYTRLPLIRANINLGAENYPLSVGVEKKISDGHKGKFNISLGLEGMAMKMTSTRNLSSLAKISVGLRHATSGGLSWILKIQRGRTAFSLPIRVSDVMRPAYSLKVVYLGALTALIDLAIGDLIQEAKNSVENNFLSADKEEKLVLRREQELLRKKKSKNDAMLQVSFMADRAAKCRELESENGGLVILKAKYSLLGGEEMDATTQLQFWVKKSTLELPSMPMSSLLGFFDLSQSSDTCVVEKSKYLSKEGVLEWFSWLMNDNDTEQFIIPNLFVRYSVKGFVYDITVQDGEPLSLPSLAALKLGTSGQIK